MDMLLTTLSIVSAIATVFLLPILSYLIVRRDQKLDETSKAVHDLQMELIRTKGEVSVLQVRAEMASNSVTRPEFENAMANVQRGLDDIKRRLDRERSH